MNDPFYGLSELQKNKLLKKLESHTYKFNKNEEILPTLKNTNIICILTSGSARIINIDYLGEETVVENLTENSVFGTNISNIDNIECQIKAITDCTVIIKDYIIGKNTNLKDEYLQASDVTNDKAVKANDYLKIKDHIMYGVEI